MGGLRRRNVSDSKKKEILRLLEEGMTVEEVHLKAGVSRATVYKIRKSAKMGQQFTDSMRNAQLEGHWHDLAGLCERIVSVCEYHKFDLTHIETIGELPEFEVDVVFSGKYRTLQSWLLDHLKAQFPRLKDSASLDELPKEYIDELRQLAATRNFKGTCGFCRSSRVSLTRGNTPCIAYSV